MSRLKAITIAVVFTACASNEKTEPICPTVASEPISACRAEKNCKNTTSAGTSIGVGFGTGGFGIGLGRSLPNESYTTCIDRDLAAQKEQREKTTANEVKK